MEAKPDALRLADALEMSSNHGIRREAAAEMRRLHGLEFALRSCELTLNKMAKKYMDASDQRDALLDAIRRLMRHIPEDAGGASLSDDMRRARKAIAQAED